MRQTKQVLLASHGTSGAQAAEQVAFDMCADNIQVTHLYVVPNFWKDMLGDDWLNNSSTRQQFGSYLETELDQEADLHIGRIRDQLIKLGISSTHKIIFGNPEQCLLDTCKQFRFDLVIIGSPRPRGVPGLRSRMATNPVTRQLTAPLLVVPYPNA